jgi:hypothetical protein
VTCVSGGRDAGVRPEDTRELAEQAGGSSLIFEEAGHLGSIKVAREAVIRSALDTFERAAAGATTAMYTSSSRRGDPQVPAGTVLECSLPRSR